METTTSNPRLRSLLVIAAFVVFTALLVYRLGDRELWLDEVITIGHTQTAHPAYDAFHPDGYYRLMYQWRQLFGSSDGALRALSVPFALLALLLVWLLASRLLPAPTAILALWLVALSPFALLYLRMARYFSLTLAATLLVVYLALLARERAQPVYYLLLGLATVALLNVDYVACLGVPLLYLWLRGTTEERRPARWWWLPAAALPAAFLLLKLPALLHDARGVAGVAAAPPTLHGLLLKLGLPFYSATVGETTDFWRFYLVVPVGLAGMLLWGLGLRNLWRRGGPNRWLLLAPWPLLVVIATVVLSTLAAGEPWPRVSSFSLYALPFFLMTVAAGTLRLRRWAAVVLVGIFLLGQLYGVSNYLARRQFLNPGYNVAWREVSRLIGSRTSPGEVAITFWDASISRYWDAPARLVDITVPGGEQQEPSLRDFPSSGGGVWLIDRDRGSDTARTATEAFVTRMRALAATTEEFSVMPLSPTEQRWRSRLGGRPADPAYLRVYHFRP
ncbi:MAG TPA: glycosyltransferase family 39 protein [Armatimonadota bacterium]|jgi:hypothetical protein